MRFIKEHYLDFVALILLLIPTVFLRFHDLGYSDYIGDEQKSFLRVPSGGTVYSFFMEQRKGPMQFLVSTIPYLVTGDYRNQFAQRSIYAAISVASVVMFYFMVKKTTESKSAAFIAAALLSFNGFIVGFGRISQYQNINLFFSFLSIYLFADLAKKSSHLRLRGVLSVIAFSISFLAHWDAVYILPVLFAYYITFLFRKDLDKKEKIKITLWLFGFGAVTLLPFMIPYVLTQLFHEANQTYFKRRVEPGFFDVNYFRFLIELYNPYLTFQVVSALALVGILNYKKSWLFIVWFVPTFLIYLFFFRKPGTHIYNFVIPAIILAGLSLDLLVSRLPRLLKFIPLLLMLPILGFFAFQSYFFFIERTKEYPWEQKRMLDFFPNLSLGTSPAEMFLYAILDAETPIYTLEQKLPLFGFPHNRYWNQINDFINEQNASNGEKYSYITNEDKSVSEWYIDTKYSDKGGFYAVGIKRPTNFISDMGFPQYGKSKKVVKEFGHPVALVKIYRVEAKVPKSQTIESTSTKIEQ